MSLKEKNKSRWKGLALAAIFFGIVGDSFGTAIGVAIISKALLFSTERT